MTEFPYVAGTCRGEDTNERPCGECLLCRATSAETFLSSLRNEVERLREAEVWLGRVLALDHPPRNEPAIDEAVKQQAREALGRLRDGD